MFRKLVLCLCVILLSAVMASAQDVNKARDMATARDVNKAKDVATAQDVNKDEAPKSLYIVPWKSSEIGAETSLDMMLTEGDVPVDRDVFRRQLEFYQVSTRKITSLSH
jgi:hypothetical protein